MKRSRYILFSLAFVSLTGLLLLAAPSTVSAYCVNDDGSRCATPSTTAPSSSNTTNTGYTIEKIEDKALTDKALCNANDCELVSKYVNPIISLLSGLVGVAVVIGIIWGGIQISTAAGDPQKVAAGKGHIQNALIALIAFAVLYAFLSWIIPGGFRL